MHDDRRLVEERLARVVQERIRPAVYGAAVPLDLSVWQAPGEPVPVAEALAAAYAPTGPGAAWGPAWGTSWFRLAGQVPSGWAGRRVEAVVDLGFDGAMAGFQTEGLAYDAGGRPLKGLAPQSRHVPLGVVAGGEPVLLYVEAAANPTILGPAGFVPTPLGDPATAGPAPLYRLGGADLAVFEPEVWELLVDVEVLAGLMRELSPQEPRRHEILRALERLLDRLDPGDVAATASDARAALAEVLARPANASAHRISAVGHAHIDSAWLWPLRETVRKCARTFAGVTALMADYPELVFACSQAQQYAWVKAHHPLVYERIRERVASGQFVPVGGMWVEADSNLPGGEALARQLVHGKRFFLEEFGVECEEVWLPDSFGYSAALPQLARLAGCRWFLTQKLSWNQTNRFPHHTFWWEGIDGSRVFTHFPPVDTYNATLSGAELAHAVRTFAEHGKASRSLVPFGYGDGGGGPTREMVAAARRLADLEGSPRVRIEPPAAFFRAAEAEYADAPVWSGELYLELHRGTYTTQAASKRGNRRSEHLLREAELWSTAAWLAGLLDYPHADLDRLWKTVLLHQFHDILPGSSIAWVHRQAEAAYAAVAQELEALVSRAVGALAGGGEGTVVFNAAPHARGGVPALGAAPAAAAPRHPPVTVGGGVLDNGLLRVTVDDRGLLASVRDLRADREVLAAGEPGNLLQLHPDLPNRWDAWDVDAFYRRQRTDLTGADEVAVVGSGPQAALRVRRSFGASEVVQTLRLPPGCTRLEVDTEVDWRERERLLKLAFPLDLHADRSSAEIQFGHVHRPTHANTSWDAARFEICAHRWLHVGEAGYGVALVNDATYGHDVTRATRPDGATTTTVRASLLRAPSFPDPHADRGRHRFRHALVCGAGIADAVREGYRLNLPERRARGTRAVAPVVAVDHPAVVVEAVKAADDRSGHVVVRLYESLGGQARARLEASFPVARAHVADLLERPLAEQPAGGAAVALRLRPFQVLTLRLTPGR